MLFTSASDFFEKTAKMKRLSREEEKETAVLMNAGEISARERIIESYLIVVALQIKRLSKDMHSLALIYGCVEALERAVDNFNFLQDNETFMHRLSLITKKEFTNYIAKQ